MACNCGSSPYETKEFEELKAFIHEQPVQNDSALIKVLHRAQGIFGYLPKEVQIFVAEQLSVPISKVYGVISFYSFFTDQPRGEYVIQVCIGTGCFVKGANKVMDSFASELKINPGETTNDMKFTLSGVRCVGACGLAPVVIVNEKVFGHVQPDDVQGILEQYLIDEAMAVN